MVVFCMVVGAVVVQAAKWWWTMATARDGWAKETQRWVAKMVDNLLHPLLKNPRQLWRVSPKQWHEELAADMPFHLGCRNCAWWDVHLASDTSSRLHKAVDHVYMTGGGLRMGEEVPDRWCSCSSSAAIAICRSRSAPNSNLFRVRVHTGDALDLRWIAEDVPYLQSQCHACYLPDEATP